MQGSEINTQGALRADDGGREWCESRESKPIQALLQLPWTQSKEYYPES